MTRFFREDHHFQTLETEILPDLIQRVRQGGRARIWSAGCSTGEEPYSIAIRLLEAMPDAGKFDIRILGTDIDRNVVAHARDGQYVNVDETHLPRPLRERYFTRADGPPGALQVAPDVRALVSMAELNLLKDWPMKGPFDVIFCRNVVIYFDAETQARLWTRFADILAPGGRLFLGHSERVNTNAEPRLKPGGITQYTRV
ncbi:MAG: protein-glutamate O-methyltransferase CheR [Paracoccaceae bacterium]